MHNALLLKKKRMHNALCFCMDHFLENSLLTNCLQNWNLLACLICLCILCNIFIVVFCV